MDEAFVRRLAFHVHFAIPARARPRPHLAGCSRRAPVADDVDVEFLGHRFQVAAATSATPRSPARSSPPSEGAPVGDAPSRAGDAARVPEAGKGLRRGRLRAVLPPPRRRGGAGGATPRDPRSRPHDPPAARDPGAERLGLAGADVVFDLPDADWRGGLGGLTVDCYLYDLRENAELRTEEPLLQRSADGSAPHACGRRPGSTAATASRRGAPRRTSRSSRSIACSARSSGSCSRIRRFPRTSCRGRSGPRSRRIPRSSRLRTGSGTSRTSGARSTTAEAVPELRGHARDAARRRPRSRRLAPVVQRVKVEGRHLAELA